MGEGVEYPFRLELGQAGDPAGHLGRFPADRAGLVGQALLEAGRMDLFAGSGNVA